MKKKCLPNCCHLRFFHGFPSPEAFDLYIDDKPFAKNILYEDFTSYYSLLAQDYTLTICHHRKKEVLFSQKLRLHMKKNYTMALFPTRHQDYQLLLLNEPPKEIPEEMLLARTINLSCEVEPLKLIFKEIKPAFKPLQSAHFTSYLAYKCETYHLQLFKPSTEKSLYEQKKLYLKPSRYYAFYIIGGMNTYPLKVISSIEGSSLYHFETT